MLLVPMLLRHQCSPRTHDPTLAAPSLVRRPSCRTAASQRSGGACSRTRSSSSTRVLARRTLACWQRCRCAETAASSLQTGLLPARAPSTTRQPLLRPPAHTQDLAAAVGQQSQQLSLLAQQLLVCLLQQQRCAAPAEHQQQQQQRAWAVTPSGSVPASTVALLASLCHRHRTAVSSIMMATAPFSLPGWWSGGGGDGGAVGGCGGADNHHQRPHVCRSSSVCLFVDGRTPLHKPPKLIPLPPLSRARVTGPCHAP